MFISKDEYYQFLDYKEMNKKLEEEIKRLEYMLNTREKTCKIGAWCKNCGHWVEDESVITSHIIENYTSEDFYYGAPIPEELGGKVGYCNKYINNLCPDFVIKN